MEAIQAVKHQLEERFYMSDMGKLHHVLGIKVVHRNNGEIPVNHKRTRHQNLAEEVPARKHENLFNPFRCISCTAETS